MLLISECICFFVLVVGVKYLEQRFESKAVRVLGAAIGILGGVSTITVYCLYQNDSQPGYNLVYLGIYLGMFTSNWFTD